MSSDVCVGGFSEKLRFTFLSRLETYFSSFRATSVIKANLWWADFWHQQHVALFTDMSVIDRYVINQSIELANNMTYMREAKPLGAS